MKMKPRDILAIMTVIIVLIVIVMYMFNKAIPDILIGGLLSQVGMVYSYYFDGTDSKSKEVDSGERRN